MDAVNKILPNDKGKADHEALKNNDNSHKGVNNYNKAKKELINKDPNYNEVF